MCLTIEFYKFALRMDELHEEISLYHTKTTSF